MNRPRNIIVHHSWISYNENPNQFDAIDRYHRGKGWGMIGYHYVIEKDGTVKAGRKESQTGAHTSQRAMNYFSIGICLTGNFDIEKPTEEQKKSLKQLIKAIQKKYRIADKNVYPHRHFATYKSCWGSKLPNDILGYIDLPETSEAPRWARKGLKFVLNNALMSNDRPNDPVTRAELATILERFYQLITK